MFLQRYNFKLQLLEEWADDLLPDSDPTYARVANVANRLLKANVDVQQIHGKEWTISVIQNDERNAFVLPVSKINELLVSFL